MAESRTIIVSDAPSGFLKRRVMRGHFEKYGKIVRTQIMENSSSGFIRFEKVEEAQNAIQNGSVWKGIHLKVEFLHNYDPFSIRDESVMDELNWYHEESDSVGKIKINESKTKFRKSEDKAVDLFSLVPLKKTSRLEEDDFGGRRNEGTELKRKKVKTDRRPVMSDVKKKETKSEKQREEANDVKRKEMKIEKLPKLMDVPSLFKQCLTLNEKLTILEERDRQLRLKLEKNTRLDKAEVVKGTCPDMCPEKERILRDVRGIVASYEANSSGSMDHSKAVKEYARSSADQDEPLPHELRPEPVLTMTMMYLLEQIISRIDEGDDNFANWYDFCWGRLRSIRKDIIQQQLLDLKTVTIVEQCARFHIVCYDRLWGMSQSHFDDKINTETLVNCLQALMYMYEDLLKEGTHCPNQAEFIGYLILLELNSGFLFSEYSRYSSGLQLSEQVKEAVRIHLVYNNNLFSNYFKLTQQTSYLNACLMQRFFHHLRVNALEIIVKAHCIPNKTSNISVQFLTECLKFDYIEDCITFCESCGISLTKDDKYFRVSRSDFSKPDYVFITKSSSRLVTSKRIPIVEAVLGDNVPLSSVVVHTHTHKVHDSFTVEGVLHPDALDASDQEEKMLRDVVERAMSRLHKSTRKSISPQELSDISPFKFESSEHTSLHSVSTESFKEKIDKNSVSSEDVPYDDPDGEIFEDEEDDDEEFYLDSMETKDDKKNSEISVSLPLDPTTPVSDTHPISTQPLKPSITTKFSKPDIHEKSSGFGFIINESKGYPKSEIVDWVKPREIKSTDQMITKITHISPSSAIKPIIPSTTTSNVTKPIFSAPLITSNAKPLFSQSVTSDVTKPLTLTKKTSAAITTLEVIQPAPQKVSISIKPKGLIKRHKFDPEAVYLSKLRKKLSEDLKKVSARKYLRIWKQKVEKLKLERELESILIYHTSTATYLKVWGKAKSRRNSSFAVTKRLKNRKKNNIMVQILLHSDLIDKMNPSCKLIGEKLRDNLAMISVNNAYRWGNISQPNPVFWKLVFSLPPPVEGGSTFPTKLKKWCQKAFYQIDNSILESKYDDYELQASSFGVPIFINVTVVEGLTKEIIKKCHNLSAVIIIRAHGWETTAETSGRLNTILSLCPTPIPVVVLNVGFTLDIIEKPTSSVTYFNQLIWKDSTTFLNVVTKLTNHTIMYNVKVKPFCTLIDLSVEKMFDLLHEDRYVDDNLDNDLKNPNKVILIYNKFIEYIEKEILHCQKLNYYGTAYEFKEKYNYLNIFPDNYTDTTYQNAISLRCSKCKLNEIKWPFKSSIEFFNYFKNYCDNINCLNILPKMMRYINPPDDDDDERSLMKCLNNVNWILVIEMIVKEILTSQLLSFRIVFRETEIKSYINSHYWSTDVK